MWSSEVNAKISKLKISFDPNLRALCIYMTLPPKKGFPKEVFYQVFYDSILCGSFSKLTDFIPKPSEPFQGNWL